MIKNNFIVFILCFIITACSQEGKIKLEETVQSHEPIEHDEVIVTKRIYDIDFFKENKFQYLTSLKVNNEIVNDLSKYKKNCHFDVGHYEDGFEVYILNSAGNTEGVFKLLNEKGNILYYDFLNKNFRHNYSFFCASKIIGEYINVDSNFILNSIDNYYQYLVDAINGNQLIRKKYVENGWVMEFYTDPMESYKTIFFIYKEK